jgi:hypothetical protein
MTRGKGWAVCGAFALLAMVAAKEAGAQSAGASGSTQWSKAWPKPSDSALSLVRLMREDETVLAAARQLAAKDKVKSRCLARMQPAALTSPIGSVIMLKMSPKEIDEAVRFFQTDAGRKATEIKLGQVRDGIEDPFDARLPQLSLPEMQEIANFAKGSAGGKVIKEKVSAHVGVRAEVYDYVTRCEAVLTGESPSPVCRSEPVSAASGMCSATYSVTQRLGEKLRHTNVYVMCRAADRDTSAFIAEFEGQHETIGFLWPDERTLEVLLPPAAKAVRKQAESYTDPKQRYVYRERKATDAPAPTCRPNPEFIDPTKPD